MQNNVGLFLAKRAQLNPNLESVVDLQTDRRFTYKQTNERANRVGNALVKAGIKKGDRVALLLMNSAEFIESFFGIAKIGAVAVPLNWRLVPEELAFILKDSGSVAMIFDNDFVGAAQDLQGRGAEGTDVTSWIHLGDAAGKPDFALSYADITGAASGEEPEIGAQDDDMLYLMYTSGTTGRPKGVVHTHNTSMWATLTTNPSVDMRFRDRYMISLPMFHVGALTPMAGCIYGGVTAVVMRSFDPSLTWKTIESEKITNMLAVPAMLGFMLFVPEHETADVSSLRWVMSGAAPVPVSLMETYQKKDVEIHQVYGLTETCGPACVISPDDAMRKLGSTGKAFFHTDIKIVDKELNPLPPGEPGEILIKGPHVMKEYWNRPDATEETLTKDGWLWSGDIAVMDDEGFVYIQDRSKDMIISGGENVYPAEVENCLLENENIAECAVIGQPSDKWGESAFAVIVVKPDAQMTEQDVLDHCKGKLSKFKLPRGAAFVDQIPRNPTGKILKRVLRDQFPGPAPE